MERVKSQHHIILRTNSSGLVVNIHNICRSVTFPGYENVVNSNAALTICYETANFTSNLLLYSKLSLTIAIA